MISTQMYKEVRAITEHFGLEHQIIKFKEELLEYLEDENEEEAGDVFLLALQRYLHSPKMRKSVEKKIKRTHERMRSGYYDL